MLDELLPRLRSPKAGLPGIRLSDARPVARSGDGTLLEAELVDATGTDPSRVRGGIWQAIGGADVPRTLAQLSNVVPPTPQLYERAWRVRSLSLLSRRPFPIEEELGELDRALPDVAGATCLDLEYSEGLYARHLAHRGALVLAVDHSVPFLRRARRRARDEGVRIAAVRAVAQHLPVGTGELDAVVVGGSLNEIGDRPAAIREALRVLRPGGVMFAMSLVDAPTGRGRSLQRLLGPSGIVFPTEAELCAEFAAVGLTIDDLRRDGVVVRTTCRRQ